MAGPAESPQGAGPRLSRVLARRTVVAVAAIVILSVPFAVFAVISGQGAASSFAALGGATALTNLVYGGRPMILRAGIGRVRRRGDRRVQAQDPKTLGFLAASAKPDHEHRLAGAELVTTRVPYRRWAGYGHGPQRRLGYLFPPPIW